MILDTTTRKLQLVLGGAKATNDCPVVVEFVEFTSTTTTPSIQSSTTNGLTPVDILAAPASSTQRKVNLISISNIDTAAITVTVQLDDNGTDYELIKGISVPVGGSLQYTDTNGWSLVERDGGTRQLRNGWVQEFTSSGTWYKPGNCRFFLVDVVGGGGGGGSGASYTAAVGKTGGGGGGGGFRARRLFLAKDLPVTVSVTVGSFSSGGAGVSASNDGLDGSAGNLSSFGTYVYGYGGGGGGGGSSTKAGGGGGGGGTSAGISNTGSTAVAGGNAMLAGATSGDIADSRGGFGAKGNTGSTVNGSVGGNSYLGGGGGGGASDTTGTLNTCFGGSSFFSAAGGGAGGSIRFNDTANSGFSGGLSGALATTFGGGGAGAVSFTSGVSGAPTLGFCGPGGGGGGIGAAAPAGNGGNGGFPGGGGGGGGASGIAGVASTSGSGGRGAAGFVRVMGW